jgi:hypothetical protein
MPSIDTLQAMTHLNMKPGLVLLVALTAGCTTLGTGFGSTAPGANPSATVRDGTTYAGQFLQLTSDTTLDHLGSLWDGWGPDWRREGWAYWNPGPEYMPYYTGRVLANLLTEDEKHMRCKFQLVNPSVGMAGGGAGECQMPGGITIDATFPRAS